MHIPKLMPLPLPPCLIFAHRGANREAPENTRAAFDKALTYPIAGIETDVQLSKDGIPVLWHDEFLDKLGYPEWRIEDMEFAQLRKLRFRVNCSNTDTSVGLLSLSEFVSRYRHRCILNIEIKQHAHTSLHQANLVKQVISITRKARSKGLFLSSFQLNNLMAAYRHAPEIPVFYLVNEQQDSTDIQQAISLAPILAGFCIHHSVLDESLVQWLRGLAKKIVVYTPNSVADLNKAIKLGIDSLITDDVPAALDVLATHGNCHPDNL